MNYFFAVKSFFFLFFFLLYSMCTKREMGQMGVVEVKGKDLGQGSDWMGNSSYFLEIELGK